VVFYLETRLIIIAYYWLVGRYYLKGIVNSAYYKGLMEKLIRIFEMGVISLSTLGTKGVMFAVWVSGSVRIYMCRFSWLVFNSVNLLGILLVVLLTGYFITPFFGLVINKINEFTQIRPNKVNRPKHRSYSTLNSIASQDKTLKQSLLCNEEGPGGGSDATAFSSYTINP